MYKIDGRDYCFSTWMCFWSQKIKSDPKKQKGRKETFGCKKNTGHWIPQKKAGAVWGPLKSSCGGLWELVGPIFGDRQLLSRRFLLGVQDDMRTGQHDAPEWECQEKRFWRRFWWLCLNCFAVFEAFLVLFCGDFFKGLQKRTILLTFF